MDFGEILTRAWNIIWRHKILWLFGLLAGLATGGNGSGGSGMNFRMGEGDFRFDRFEGLPGWMQRFMQDVPNWLPVVLVLAALILLAVVIILSTYGRIGLTRGAWLADEGEQRLTFGQLWSFGSRYFWRAVLLILLLMVLTITVFILILIPTIGITVLTMGIGLICLLPLLCVLAIAASLVGVLFDLALIAIVNEDLSVTDGLQRAWGIVRSRLGEVIAMALILWVISLVIGFAAGLPLLLISAPIIGSIIVGGDFALRGGMIIALVLFLLYLPILLLVQGFLQSYIGSAWTVVFRRLTRRAANQGSPAL